MSNLGQQKNNIRIVSIGLLIIGVLASVFQLLYGVVSASIDRDTYFLLAAGREVALSGIPRLPFFVNSTPGIDILFWTHQVPAFLYGAIVKFLDVNIFSFTWVVIAQLILTMVISFLFLRELLKWCEPGLVRYAPVFLLFLLYDPIFNILFLNIKMFLQWAYIWSVLAIIFLIWFWHNPRGWRGLVWLFLSSCSVALAPLSFISLGIPAALGIAITELLFVRWRTKGISREYAIKAFLACILGWFIPVLFLLVYLGGKLDPGQWKTLWVLVGSYGENASVLSIKQYILQLGFFGSTMFIPLQGFSLLPIGLISIFSNFVRRHSLAIQQQYLVWMSFVLVAAWLLAASVGSTHFASHLMIWILPIMLVNIAIILGSKKNSDTRAIFLTAASIIILGQASYHLVLNSLNYLAIAAAAGVTSGMIIVLYYQKWKLPVFISLFISLLFFVPVVQTRLVSLHSFAPTVLREVGRDKLWSYDNFLLATREVTSRYVQPNDWVLTNLPVTELFPEGVKLQILYNYRGLFSGARLEPGDVAILFGSTEAKSIANYQNMSVGEVFSYRLFEYEILKREELSAGHYLLVAKPAASLDANKQVIEDDRAASKSEVRNYLQWRLENNLPIK
ncbi:MAG: hypothetical protein Q8P73_01200 [bacterium]|nr:hypothetical protein [bacterium]